MYLNRRNNLGDLHNIKKSRFFLHLGNVALQNKDDVYFSNADVTLTNFSYPNSVEKKYYIASADDIGTFTFKDISVPIWTRYNQDVIKISQFNNDLSLASNVAPGMVSASIFDFVDRFNLTDFISINSYLNLDINGNNNINFEDISDCRNNLLLGDIATQFSNTVHVLNIDVQQDLQLSNNASFLSNGNMYIDKDKYVNVKEIPIANDSILGFVKTTSNNIYTNDDYTICTSHVLYSNFNYMKNRVDQNGGNIDSFMDENRYAINLILFSDECLHGNSNLLELNDLSLSLSNLGLGDICLYEASNSTVFMNHLHVYGDTFKNNQNSSTNSESYYYNTNNIDNIVSLPTAHYNNFKGVVQLIESYSNTVNNEAYTVCDMATIEQLQSDTLDILNSLDTTGSIRDMNHFSGELFNSNLISEYPEICRNNLDLHDVSHTGNYQDLKNVPKYLHNFEDDSGCIKTHKYLNDLESKEKSRVNIGLADISIQDDNMVNFQGIRMDLDLLQVDENGLFINSGDPILKQIQQDNTVPLIIPISDASKTRLHAIGIAENIVGETPLHGFVKINDDDIYNNSQDCVPTVSLLKDIMNNIKNRYLMLLN